MSIRPLSLACLRGARSEMDDNPYEVLHVDSEATPEVIEAVAGALVKRYGPDGSNPDNDMLAKVEVAQSKLCDLGRPQPWFT